MKFKYKDLIECKLSYQLELGGVTSIPMFQYILGVEVERTFLYLICF